VSKRVAIVQSNYVPWKGYFDLIATVDEFVLYDDAQYTKRDWRNRNVIKTKNGLHWLTIPVAVKGRFEQRICDAVVSDRGWNEAHWRTIRAAYARAPYFRYYEPALAELFAGAASERLSEINHRFLTGLCRLLAIDTRLTWSMDYAPQRASACVNPQSIDSGHELPIDAGCQKRLHATQRLVDICVAAKATHYLSGPAARAYIEPALFAEAGITLEYFDYSGYREYPQLYPPFEHGVSVIDLLVHAGADAPAYMRRTVAV
jgi:hypothetical protein